MIKAGAVTIFVQPSNPKSCKSFYQQPARKRHAAAQRAKGLASRVAGSKEYRKIAARFLADLRRMLSQFFGAEAR